MNFLWFKMLLNGHSDNYNTYSQFRRTIQSVKCRNDCMSIPNKIVQVLHLQPTITESDVVKFIKIIYGSVSDEDYEKS